jgi:hypothetical protein
LKDQVDNSIKINALGVELAEAFLPPEQEEESTGEEEEA